MFTSHSVYHLWQALSGTQPVMHTQCPIGEAIAAVPLLFDRPNIFFSYQKVILHYADKSEETILRQKLLKFMRSKFESVAFRHWTVFAESPAFQGKLMKVYFCEPSYLLRALTPRHEDLPVKVQWVIYLPNDKVIYQEDVTCGE